MNKLEIKKDIEITKKALNAFSKSHDMLLKTSLTIPKNTSCYRDLICHVNQLNQMTLCYNALLDSLKVKLKVANKQ